MANIELSQTSFDCTPSSLLASNPCLACLSEKDLLAALVAITATASRTYATDLPQLMQDSACFGCLTEKQMFQALVSVFGELLLQDQTVPEVIDNMKCLLCAPRHQLLAAFLYLMCTESLFSAQQPT